MIFNLKSFSLIESMIAFFLFSFMLVTYIPGYHLEVNKIQTMKIKEARWHLFYDLVQLHYQNSNNQEQMTLRKYAFEENYGGFTTFECNETYCAISFNDGEYYEIEIQALQ